MTRTIALPLAAIIIMLTLSARVAAQDAPLHDPIPTPTGAASPGAAPLHPDDLPPSDAVVGADAAAFRVHGINKVPRGDCGGGRGHQGTDGSWPWHRMEWAGYPGRYDGEAIHCGTHDVASAVRLLLESPPHRAFLLSPIPVEVGVGVHPIISDVEWRRGSHSTVMVGGTPNP